MRSEQEKIDELLRRASFGELTGDQADAEAERLGLGKLSSKPDPADFDPERETHWTIPMAVAWIAYRSKDAVREAWEPYCAKCWHWVWRRWRNGPDGEIHEGWSLEQWSRPTLAKLAIGAAYHRATGEGDSVVMSVADAEAAIWSALREEMIPATGVGLQSGRRTSISALEWQELKPYEARGERDEVRAGPLATGYREVQIPSEGVQWIWPVPRASSLSLPASMPPEGDGYMPLFCAALWIATGGGTETFDPADEVRWRVAYTDLLAAISSDRVRVIGTKDGARAPVPGYLFADCAIDYPYADASIEMILSDDLYLRSYPYIDEDHWRRGFDDALISRRKERWSRLMVAKSDIRGRWPFELTLPDQTGAPGRPTSMYLIFDELERRADSGLIEDTLRKQSEELVVWLASKHPQRSRPKPNTVANQIRSRYRALKGPTK